MLLREACEKFLFYSEHTKKLSPHSIKAYRRDIQTFQEFAGFKTNTDSIDRNTLNAFVNSLFDHELSPATVKRRLACLKCLFKWLQNEEIIVTSPFNRFELKIRLPHRLPRNLSVHELSKLLRNSKDNLELAPNSSYKTAEFNPINKSNINKLSTLLCVELLFSTGIRVSELTNITLTDIYLEEQYIHIKGKGQRERRVFLTDNNLKNLVASYIQLRSVTQPDHNKLLVNSLGRPATTQIVRIWLRKISESANLNRRATPHMYRHSAATELLSAGVEISYVQKLLGHQSINTTQIYTHINHSDVQKTVSKVNIRRSIL